MEVFFTIAIIILGVCVLVLTPSFLRSRERMKLIELVRASSDRGQPLPPEVLSTLTEEPKPLRPSHVRDIRRGIVLISAAIAVEIIALCIHAAVTFGESDPGDANEAVAIGLSIAGFGAIPLCIGLAFLLLGLTGKKTEI